MKGMNKKAQYYLVAAIIIVMVISGIASVKTYAVATSKPRKITDIGSELKEEGYRIIDYGIYNADVILNDVLADFDANYSDYFLKKTDATNIIFVYGNKTNLYSVQYNPSYTGSVFATIGGVAPTWATSTIIINRSQISVIGNNDVSVNILDRNFNFTMRNNEMFYFLITQEREGEIFIERN